MTRTVSIASLGDWISRGWYVVSYGNSDRVLIARDAPTSREIGQEQSKSVIPGWRLAQR